MIKDKSISWLLPIILILFISAIMTLPIVFWNTFASKNTDPTHIVTYENYRLNWDNTTEVDNNGVAILDLFSNRYTNVISSNNETVIAPGTSSNATARLFNKSENKISYVAILYETTESNEIPINITMECSNSSEISDYKVPDSIAGKNILNTVEGILTPNTFEDFNISWVWDFYTDDYQDSIDTKLGSELPKMSIGLYLVVIDDNIEIVDTGDNNFLILYYIIVFAVLAILLLKYKFRENKQKSGGVNNCEK